MKYEDFPCVFVCHTASHVLRSAIYSMTYCKHPSLLIIPNSSLISDPLLKRLIASDFFRVVQVLDASVMRYRKWMRYLMWMRCMRPLLWYLSKKNTNIWEAVTALREYPHEVFIFNDSLFFSELVMHVRKCVKLLEEGKVNYLELHDLYSKFEICVISVLGRHYRMGRSNYIQEVLLSNSRVAPSDIRYKVCDVEIDYFSLEVSQRNNIASLFLNHTDQMRFSGCNIVLYVMQDLSILGLQFSDILSFHQRVVDQYSDGASIVLCKAHPNDSRNYEGLSGALLLENTVPLEVFIGFLISSNLKSLFGVSLIESSIGSVKHLIQWDILLPGVSLVEELSAETLELAQRSDMRQIQSSK